MAESSEAAPRRRGGDASRTDIKQTTLRTLPCEKLETLRRNPQYLTPAQMEALKASIRRDGFVAPILVRPLKGGRYEVVSGNHRLMAARELGHKTVPCVVSDMSAASASRLAVNLNLIHGDPPAELLAPFLAELSDEVLGDIHLEGQLRSDVLALDASLAETMRNLERELPDSLSRNAPLTRNPTCRCSNCGHRHVSSSEEKTSTPEPKPFSTEAVTRPSSAETSSVARRATAASFSGASARRTAR